MEQRKSNDYLVPNFADQITDIVYIANGMFRATIRYDFRFDITDPADRDE
jgi:hypothetical protein